jgi:stearoyl-CoA desaturase (delta-9 desaturase)
MSEHILNDDSLDEPMSHDGHQHDPNGHGHHDHSHKLTPEQLARQAALPKDWVTISFLTLTPVIGIVGTAIYTAYAGFSWWMPALTAVLYLLVGLSVTAGYHRHFSHKTYDCHPAVQVFYAIFGAMSVQNTIAAWSAGHRRHHQHVDDDWDPYCIKRGFWWAHIVWIFYKNPASKDRSNVPDLMRNPIVRWQDRYYLVILVLGSFVMPALIGLALGDWIAGLLWGGFLRVVVTHQTTFFVNSLAHTFGQRTYDPAVSACDNWGVALLTLGEGYHSYHHKFPADYRNGIKWYHWDPSKWLIRSLEFVGLAQRLRRTPDERIEAARMKSAMAGLQERIATAPEPIGAEVQRRLGEARQALERALELRRRRVQESGENSRDRRARKLEKRELAAARAHWTSAAKLLSSAPAIAEAQAA